MKIQRLSKRLIISRNRDHDPQIGLIRFLLFITAFIMVLAVYTIFR